MDIVALSTELSQNRVLDAVSVGVQKLAMTGAKDQGEGLVKMMEAARAITDPALGNAVNILA